MEDLAMVWNVGRLTIGIMFLLAGLSFYGRWMAQIRKAGGENDGLSAYGQAIVFLILAMIMLN